MKKNIKILIVLASVVIAVVVLARLFMFNFNVVRKDFPNPDPTAACVQKCHEQLTSGIDLSNGPCISNTIATGWVCDVAHNPRQAVDNLLENQCSEYGKSASHFVEVDSTCNFIRAI